MAQVINTNSLSLLTQNNMNKSQSALSTSIERLSSGLRINSAKDDAAGQAIANRFTSNIKGLTQAARNANDGISVAQTTEGSLSEINNNLQRIRELTVQATNGTNSDSDLTSIQDEITSRLSEIDRVSGQTQFNGVKVLASDNTMKIQVGANDGETISIDLQKIDSKSLGLNGFNVNGAQKVTGSQLISEFKATGTDNYKVGADTFNVNVDSGAVTKGGDAQYISAKDGSFTNSKTTANTAVIADADVEDLAKSVIGKKAGETFQHNDVTFTLTNDADVNGNAKFTASVGGKDVALEFADSTDTDGKDAKLTGAVYKDAATEQLTTAATQDNRAAKMSDLDLQGAKKDGSTLKINGKQYDVNAAGDQVTAQFDDGKGTNTTVAKTVYLGRTEAGAATLINEDAAKAQQSTANPLEALDDAISKIDKFRSSLGAVQNRLDSAITNLNNTTTNLSSAQSRIQDADYATEVSNMSKAQILQQAGNSVLSKANQVPQQVLSLLQG